MSIRLDTSKSKLVVLATRVIFATSDGYLAGGSLSPKAWWRASRERVCAIFFAEIPNNRSQEF
jgi:hypothetical protein